MAFDKEIGDYETYLNQSEKLIKFYVGINDYKAAFYTLIKVLSYFPIFEKFTSSFENKNTI